MALDRYAVLGNPVAHSRSPFIHLAFARASGESISYERVLCPLAGFEPALRAFAASGARGCNVTLPFKFEAARLAAQCSERAARAGAANMLRLDEQGWLADNTDGAGLVRDIEEGAGVPLRARRVLLVGAGGAAAGALGALIEARPAALVVVNRTLHKAKELTERHAGWAEQHGVALRAATLADPGEAYDVVINATSASLAQAGAPVSAAVLAPGSLALDMMYGPPAQAFLAWADAGGAVGRDGLGMLVQQAAEAFWIFRGMRPASAPVLAALRKQLAAEAG